MKRAALQHLGRHAATDFSGKAGGADLAGGKHHRIEQHHPPSVGLYGVGQEQLAHALQGGRIERAQPTHVKRVGKHQSEQLAAVGGFGRAGQQLEAEATAKFAQKGGAWRKTEVGQQRCHVQRGAEHTPPILPALLQFRIGLYRVQQLVDTRQRRAHVGGLTAYPSHHTDQPQVALCQWRVGIQCCQQGEQLLVGGHGGRAFFKKCQCSTRPGVPAPLSSTNSGISASKRVPSSATQK